MLIREYIESDWPKLWSIIEPVFRAGETYAFSPDIDEVGAKKVWIESAQKTFVAVNSHEVIEGTYYIKPNQPGLGSHVSNCGYIVSEASRGKGIASLMCEHSQKVALDMGFTAMQYNLVVSTNTSAINLWKKHGFSIIATLPHAYKSLTRGFVDAYILFKKFDPTGNKML